MALVSLFKSTNQLLLVANNVFHSVEGNVTLNTEINLAHTATGYISTVLAVFFLSCRLVHEDICGERGGTSGGSGASTLFRCWYWVYRPRKKFPRSVSFKGSISSGASSVTTHAKVTLVGLLPTTRQIRLSVVTIILIFSYTASSGSSELNGLLIAFSFSRELSNFQGKMRWSLGSFLLTLITQYVSGIHLPWRSLEYVEAAPINAALIVLLSTIFVLT